MKFDKQEPVLHQNETVTETEVNLQESKKDYLSFVHILHEYNIPYCMDSGVLLGLMRDGKLFDHEKDVDLQMWAEHEERLRKLLPVFREQDYKVTIWLYKDLIYQYRFIKEGYIPIHLMLFRKAGDRAWCPAGRGIGPPYPRMLTTRFYRYFVIARKRLRERLVATDVSHHPWKIRRDLGTWWIAAKYFENVTYHEKYETYIPGQWQEYLTYRYGNWRFPDLQWDFWINDGGLLHLPPEEVVDFSSLVSSSDGSQLMRVRKDARGRS